jgi:serine/threonine-protein kinase
MATRRAAKLAGAFTEEFAPSGPPVPTPSRLVPLTGVALLLAGGAAGVFVAINGGLAAVTADEPQPSSPPAAAAAVPASTAPQSAPPSTPPSQPPARRPGAVRTPEPGPVPAPILSIPVTEGSVLPTNPSVEASSTSPEPSPSASESDPDDDATHTEEPRSRHPRPRR